MSDRFSNAFAFGITNPARNAGTYKIDLRTTIEPIVIGPKVNTEMIIKTLNNQIKHFADIGLPQVAVKLQELLPPDPRALQTVPPVLAKGLTNPVVMATIMQIAFNRAFGEEFHDRFNAVKWFLTLAEGESTFNPGAVNGVHRGLLQFDPPTEAVSRAFGQRLTSQSVVLSTMFAFMRKQYPTQDLTQVMPNVGQIFRLRNRIAEEWIWDKAGWTPKVAIAANARTKFLISQYPKILASRDLGVQLLMTIYHTVGINAFGPKSIPSFPHPNRLYEDVLRFYHMGRIPGLVEIIHKCMPGSLGSLFQEVGDASEDLFAAIHINQLWKALLQLPYHPFAKADSIPNSSWGPRKALRKPDGTVIPAHFHKGVDFPGVVGQPVFALFDGIISKSVDEGKRSWGQRIEVKSPILGLTQRVGHLSKRLFSEAEINTPVKKGDMIGLVGSSGNVTGPHLHIEVFTTSTGSQLEPTKWPVAGKYAINKYAT